MYLKGMQRRYYATMVVPTKPQGWDPNGLRSAAYWRQRAETARLCAADMTNDEVRATLLDIAIIYDSMADRAARREGRAKSPSAPNSSEKH
jgi:hypothetical protein